MAKGVEDTAFYRYVRLLALNDVGGDPARFGISVDEFHAANAERAAALPAQPARHPDARHQALGRRARADRRAGRRWPDEWAAHVRRWLDAAGRCTAAARPTPDEQLLRLPDAARRVADHRGAPRGLPREGAARGQAHTNWVEPDEAHEAAVQALRAPRCSTDRAVPRATSSRSASSVAEAGDRAALGQLAAEADRARACPTSTRATSCSCLSLVDPDNRRPVDWERAPRARCAPSDPPAEAATDPRARSPCARAGRRRSRAPTSRSTPAPDAVAFTARRRRGARRGPRCAATGRPSCPQALARRARRA